MDIARIIREGRERLKLNQSELAELVGVSPQAVQQWESGATQPRGKRLNRIAEALKLPPAMMHFGMSQEVPAAAPDKTVLREPDSPVYESRSASPRVAKKPAPENDALINQVIEAMRRMSKEDAARLVTISKALVGETAAAGAEASPSIDLKPLPVPDLAPHPPPAFPPRRMPESRTKIRGKTAIR